ncbi:MAG: methionine--tRNA ligase [Ardenticatenaceae bacterium]|nr:methionine--tRNA ligase [Ardenticatenaceae bacterium]
MTNKEHILVSVAWPYANADIHVGNVTGSYLPADIYARYHRLKGNHVLMVSGSDSHGTPVTVKAEELGQTIQEVFDYYHDRFLRIFEGLGLSYDLFTHTNTENHFQVAQDMFLALLNNGFLYKKVTEQMYSPTAGKFLPDRYIEGICPVCGYERARGDQCDNCNTLFESAAQLINPRSKTDDSELELRETEHFFIDLPKLAKTGLERWIQNEKEHWRPHVLKFTRNWIMDEGLIGRAITRDISGWGIPVPVKEYEHKTLYVWFEAVIGYLSAAIEWAHNQGQPEAWKKWWQDPDARSVYFIGKDNIPFHTIIWPAQLLGVGSLYSDDGHALNLPYDVPANEFMNMEGRKISGSMNWGVWIVDALERHDPDPLRYYLTAVMPETRDSDWSWDGYVTRNNTELVANWGNLANRVLNMIQKYFDGVVPNPGPLTDSDKALLEAIDDGFVKIGELYDGCKFRAALQETMRLSTLINQYLDETSPWKAAKTDLAAAGHALNITLQAISGLKILFAPVLPFTCQRLHEMLGEEGRIFGGQEIVTYEEKTRSHRAMTYNPTGAVGSWSRPEIPAGRQLPKPKPLFKKLDPSVVEEELARLG